MPVQLTSTFESLAIWIKDSPNCLHFCEYPVGKTCVDSGPALDDHLPDGLEHGFPYNQNEVS